MKILFRVDGGRIWGISMGHVFRCIELAEEIKNSCNADIQFVMKNYESGISIVEKAGMDVQPIKRDISSEEEIELIGDCNVDVVVFDIIDIEKKETHRLMERGIKTVIIDDTGDKELNADLVINGSIVPASRVYPETSKVKNFCLGPDYSILGKEFKNCTNRIIEKKVKAIMVSMGGSDPAGLTLKVVDILCNHSLDPTINVILGPAFQEEGEVRNIIKKSKNKFNIFRNVPSLAEVMIQSDIAIAAGGRTAYELAATGTPSILIPSIENEKLVACAFEKEETCIVADDKNLENSISQKVTHLLNDSRLRIKMCRKGQALIDSCGRIRVTEFLQQIVYGMNDCRSGKN